MESKKDKREEEKTKNGAVKTKKNTVKKESKTKKDDSKAKGKESTTKNNKTTSEKKEDKIRNSKTKNNEIKSKEKEKNEESKVGTTTGIKMERKTGSRVFTFIWNIFVKILTIAIIFVSIIIVVQKVTNNQESFLGFRIFRVQTGSMIPKYQIGDVILVKEVDTDKIQIGDDVTYEGNTGTMNGMLVTHRVVDIEEVDGKRVFHTKGIANNLEDPVISEEQINGVVQTKMYILSLICMLLNNKYVFYFCGILPLTIYVAFRFFRNRRVRKIEREN